MTPHDSDGAPAVDASTTTVVRGPTPCANCGAELRVGDRFCEACGHAATSPAPAPAPALSSPPATVLAVRASRDAWARFAEGRVPFPAGVGEQEVALDGDVFAIGRADDEGGWVPDLDVAARTADPGVSRRHAELCRDADGTWAVTDLGSANGTWRNDDPDPIPPGVPVVLVDGDRVHVGAYTVLQLRRA